MKRVILIIGCFLVPVLFLYLLMVGTVTAVEKTDGEDATCIDCGPTIYQGERMAVNELGGGPAIILTKTVDTNPQTCASSETYTLPAGGGTVYYCYFVGNVGDVTMTLHTVVDDQIGTLIGPSFPFALIPGATAWFTIGVNITQTTVNSATWRAFNPGPTDVVTSTDTALVIVEGPITALTATNDGPTTLGRETTLATMISGGGNETYTWAFGDGLTGTGGITSHIYPAVGVYTAVVTATNSFNSLTASTIVTIHYANYMPAVFRP